MNLGICRINLQCILVRGNCAFELAKLTLDNARIEEIFPVVRIDHGSLLELLGRFIKVSGLMIRHTKRKLNLSVRRLLLSDLSEDLHSRRCVSLIRLGDSY
jgi:hypothetical protein